MRGRDIIVEPVRLADIFIVGDRRPVNEKAVDLIVNSVESIGLQHPITIRYVEVLDLPDEGELHGAYVLVAGRHRMAAYERLGRERIECVVLKGDETDARLWEIAENLHRAELSTSERDEQISEWVRLVATKVGDASPTIGGVQPKEAGIRKAAAELGLDVKTIRKAVAISGMEPEIKQASEAAGLTRSEMYQVAKTEPARQADVVADFAEAKATKLDTDIKNRAAEEMAEAIVEHMPHALHGMMKENAWVCAKPLAIALTNLLGGAVMDKGAA